MPLKIRKILCWFGIHPYNPKYLKRDHWDAGDWKGKNIETCKLCGYRKVWYDKQRTMLYDLEEEELEQ